MDAKLRAELLYKAMDRAYLVSEVLNLVRECMPISERDRFDVSAKTAKALERAERAVGDLYQALGREWDAAETKARE